MTESGRVGYRQKYWVAGRVRVPAGHCLPSAVNPSTDAWGRDVIEKSKNAEKENIPEHTLKGDQLIEAGKRASMDSANENQEKNCSEDPLEESKDAPDKSQNDQPAQIEQFEEIEQIDQIEQVEDQIRKFSGKVSPLESEEDQEKSKIENRNVGVDDGKEDYGRILDNRDVEVNENDKEENKSGDNKKEKKEDINNYKEQLGEESESDDNDEDEDEDEEEYEEKEKNLDDKQECNEKRGKNDEDKKKISRNMMTKNMMGLKGAMGRGRGRAATSSGTVFAFADWSQLFYFSWKMEDLAADQADQSSMSPVQFQAEEERMKVDNISDSFDHLLEDNQDDEDVSDGEQERKQGFSIFRPALFVESLVQANLQEAIKSKSMESDLDSLSASAQCVLCKIYFSAHPNKLRPILKFKKYYPIEHIFVPACSSARKIHF